MTLKIVADENIPHLHALFSAFGNINALPGRKISATDVADADILLVRSVTSVSAELLRDSGVRFVGTCTIGTDHLDTDFLTQHNIAFASAPGCNANAVVQYVVGVLAELDRLHEQANVVVVGGGNVGGRVYDALHALGFHCQVVDPFLPQDGHRPMSDFDAVFEADIVCVHTPLTTDGPHPTHHLFNQSVLQQLKKNTLLINAGRGGAIDNAALLRVLEQRSDLSVVLDVWENEPDINPSVLAKVNVGSPHIAGYSLEGRLNGALMIFDALKHFLLAGGQCDIAGITQAEIAKQTVELQALGSPETIAAQTLRETICAVYPVSRDHKHLVEAVNGLPDSFDALRKNYPQRREFSHYRCANVPTAISKKLQSLGFIID